MCEEDSLTSRIHDAIRDETRRWFEKEIKDNQEIQPRIKELLDKLTAGDMEPYIRQTVMVTLANALCTVRKDVKDAFMKELQQDVIDVFKGEWNNIKIYMIEQLRYGRGIEASTWDSYRERMKK